MTEQKIKEIINKQKVFFETGATLSVSFRINTLKKLKSAIICHEAEINEALYSDLGKSSFEGYMCEVGMVLSEISHMLRHIKSYAKPKKVLTPLAQFPGKSYVKKCPYGVCLIMSPWNYPVLLTLGPLIDAVAAGNTVILKPSAYSPATTKVLMKILSKTFDEQYIAVVDGGREENAFLLEEKFDYIFFTGGKTVGKLVMEKASRHLTPITLELGGKSPVILHKDANIPLSAKRIVWGKFLNCGQTCVAPDYVLCHKDVLAEFLKCAKREIQTQLGNALENKNYGKIINAKHFDRLLGLMDNNKIICGGGSNREKLKIEPTIMSPVTPEDKIMQEEIFGPILPVLTYENIQDAIAIIAGGEKPLALYAFTESKETAELITTRCSFGGGCVNDVIIHLATSRMGFGGVGESGMGSYHGKEGFDTFSHKKSIVDKKTWMDMPMRYQPYTQTNEKMIRMFLK